MRYGWCNGSRPECRCSCCMALKSGPRHLRPLMDASLTGLSCLHSYIHSLNQSIACRVPARSASCAHTTDQMVDRKTDTQKETRGQLFIVIQGPSTTRSVKAAPTPADGLAGLLGCLLRRGTTWILSKGNRWRDLQYR